MTGIYRSLKEEMFRDIAGTVVEIGPGTEINFTYLPASVNWIGLEPNPSFHKLILQKAAARGIDATIIDSAAEKINLPDESVDVVISTLVLCSVRDLSSTLGEIKRVLRKGGKLILIEHVAAERGTRLRKKQQLLNPINRLIADGCNCNRETWIDIQNAGFSSVDIHHKKLKGTMALHAPHIFGRAIK